MLLLQVPGCQAVSKDKLGVFDCCQGTGCVPVLWDRDRWRLGGASPYTHLSQAPVLVSAAPQARLERDRDVMQLQRSLDTLQQGSQREVADLQTQVDRLQRSKETAEVRTAGLEETVRQQEQLLTSMRWAGRETECPPHSVTFCCNSDV